MAPSRPLLSPVAVATAVVSGLLLLTACGGSSAADGGRTTARSRSASSSPARSPTTASWARPTSATSGRRRSTAGAVEFSNVEQVATADYEKALVRFATTSDLVISIGGQTDADVRNVAARFPG